MRTPTKRELEMIEEVGKVDPALKETARKYLCKDRVPGDENEHNADGAAVMLALLAAVEVDLEGWIEDEDNPAIKETLESMAGAGDELKEALGPLLETRQEELQDVRETLEEEQEELYGDEDEQND